MARSKRAEKLIERHKKMLAERQVWLPQWQIIGEYVMTRKQNFTSQKTQGQFLTGKIYDSTAPAAMHLAASTILGALWPNGGKTFQLLPPKSLSKEDSGRDDVKEFYKRATEIMTRILNDPKANLISILNEYMLDQLSFGTSGVGVFDREDVKLPVQFEAIDAKKMCIAEGKDGFVERIFLQHQMTVYQLVEEYNLENLSPKTQKLYKEGQLEEKVNILRVIEPRIEGSKASFGNKNMPIASMHIEYDECFEIKESGYPELPTFIARFEKAMGETYGRSPAFTTMPNILAANNLAEFIEVATEKILDPPLLIKEDGAVDGGVVDTSPRAINVRHINGRIENGGPAVEQLVTIGDITFAIKHLEMLQGVIKDDYHIDRLTDLNNEQRMTAFETNIRNEIRSQSLGSIFSRQIAELFSPLINRVFNICLLKWLFGVMPNSQEEALVREAGFEPIVIPEPIAELIASGEDAYELQFISPAARIMRYEELKGMNDLTLVSEKLAVINPESLDVIDFDETVRKFGDLSGAPAECIRSNEEVIRIREGRAQAQAAQAQQQAALIQAETMKKGAQAAQASVKAGIPPAQLGVA